jgi:ribosomal protein S27AE
MLERCPGGSDIRTPTLTVKKCPRCGSEVEVFSNEVQVACGGCGTPVYNNLQSCIQWCKFAKMCFGKDEYQRMKTRLERESKK